MIAIFKVEVTTAGTPGPLLGDNVKTIVTPLYPSDLTVDSDGLGTRVTVFNQVAASGRAHYSVARFVVMGTGDNGNVAYLLARGATDVTGRRVASYEELPPIGFGDRNDIDLSDFDVDSDANADGLTIWAEVR